MLEQMRSDPCFPTASFILDIHEILIKTHYLQKIEEQKGS